jgi:hypothetical protein
MTSTPLLLKHYKLSSHINLKYQTKIYKQIADAVKDNIMTDITNLVLSHTQPLREEIDKLKYENRKLREDLDSVEQYGRRILIRISGIPEPEGFGSKIYIGH